MARIPLKLLTAFAALAGCAPDAWRSNPAFDSFLNDISKACYPRTIGGATIDGLMADPYFLDQTSRLYHRAIAPKQYASAMNAFYKGDNAAALQCIVAKLPGRSAADADFRR